MAALDLATLKALAAEARMDPRTAGRILRDAGVAEHPGRRFSKAAALAVLDRDADPALLAGHALVARGSGMSTATASLAEARTGSEQMRRRRLELLIDKEAGRLLKKDQIEAAAADIITRARSKFLALGPRVAPKVVGISDVHRVADIVEAEVRAILTDLGSLDSLTDEALAA